MTPAAIRPNSDATSSLDECETVSSSSEKGGEIAGNRLEDQEISVHALHRLQSCLVHVNTLMLQRVLAEQSRRPGSGLTFDRSAFRSKWRVLD